MSKTKTSNAYAPGVCNINTTEIARRRSAGFLGLAIFAVLAFVLVYFDLPMAARVILFVPAFLAAVGFLQAHYKFCVGYAAAGLQNATDGDIIAQEIVSKAARKLDQQRRRKINTEAAVLALVATVATLFLP